jgi:HEPN domain-containing protein
MSTDVSRWLMYADENLEMARLAIGSGYDNACLQNVQQAVEKYLKAALLSRGQSFRKTHSISTLNDQLAAAGVCNILSEEDCILLDSIYMPSKYPFGSALPDFNPDEEICRKCIQIAEKVRAAVVV